MTKQKYEELLIKLEKDLSILSDKPFETPNNTLKTLAFLSMGNNFSVKKAIAQNLPAIDSIDEVTLEQLVNKRLQGFPIAYLTERENFMGHEFIVKPGALIPRNETEILGEAVKEIIAKNHKEDMKLLDICTGAGNLALSFALEFPDLSVCASDLSKDAVRLANCNVAFHNIMSNIEIKSGDLFEPFKTQEYYNNFDIVTCNPPYISSKKVSDMPQEISDFEPNLAFDGGPYGISILSRFLKEAPLFLKKSGWIAFEVGLGQGDSIVKKLDRSELYCDIVKHLDKKNNIRAITAQHVG